ncbi:hypothetical protein ABEB36_012602 [Hypothenemus hampei]|uniref:SID1 transmembrane family member 1 n=1 Tax=Hypothenemus hampei TaxID=57062 RepID=A0ABD1EBV6_HYPHA
MIFLLISSFILGSVSTLVITNVTVDLNSITTIQLSSAIEYILIYPNAEAINPYTVRAWSADATSEYPVLLVVRQERQVSSWTLPILLESSQNSNKTFQFSNSSKTLCHDHMESIINSAHPNFSIDPLVLKQMFVVALSTSSKNNVTVNVFLEEEQNFYMNLDETYTVQVSPSQSRFKYFPVHQNVSDTVIIEVTSPDDVCLTVSVQGPHCPVMDSNKDIKYEGIYQTINKKGAITIAKRQYPSGFFLVFVAKPDDYDCSQQNSIIPGMTRFDAIMDNTIITTITFEIRNNITHYDFVLVVIGTLLVVLAFCTICTILVCVCNRYGTISRLQAREKCEKDYITPISNDEIDCIVTAKELTLEKFAKFPKRIRQRAFNYLSHTGSVALFYSIPVIQLVITYQRVVNQTGNQDVCYYNFLCAHPSLGVSDFNHIFSNIGYILIGFSFVIAVADRHYRIRITKSGIPVHYGLYYAMGLALSIEGLLSGCYHICPSQSNYQFDTSFMYVMAVLIMVKLYQNRHPDINATAYSTFSVVGVGIFLAMVGILSGTLEVWIIFLLGYATLIIILSFKIYYFNFVMFGFKKLYDQYKDKGVCKEIFTPIKRCKFFTYI